MQEIVGKYIEQFKKDHRKQKKYISMLVVLALLVSSGVIWQMKLTGISMTADVQCGKKEHKHSASCYEKVLVCGLSETEQPEEPAIPVHTHAEGCYEYHKTLVCELAEHQHMETCYNEEGELICELTEHQHSEDEYLTEKILICGLEEVTAPEVEKPAPHVHTEACYENRLVCNQEEHTHSIMCMCDKNADLESEADWEATVPELTHVWVDDFLAVAESQMGYKESSRNFVLDEESEKTRGYTRYGQWYGNPYGHWCAMFVSWCLNYAEIPEEAIPYEAGCYAWTVKLDEMGLYQTPENYTPETGDIIFFYRNGRIGHVGIVESVDAEKGKVHTIEGNSGNSVRRREYDLTSQKITGYASLRMIEERYAEKYGGKIPERTLTAEIYSDEKFENLVEGSGEITVTGKLPEGAIVKAYPVEAEVEGQQVIEAYDISIFLEDGSIYEPEEPLKVTFAMPEQEEAGGLTIYYVPDKPEQPERINTTVNEEDVSFVAEHFSVYALVREVTGPTIVVNNAQEFERAFADNNVTVQLGADFEVTGTVQLNNKNIALDLNGHRLTVTGSNNLFQVSGETEFIIKDSQAANEVETTETGNLYGRIGKYDENGNLIYYVTKTEITNASTGATQETLVKYDVPLRGRIDAGNATVVNLAGGTVNLESGMLYEGTNRAFNMNGGTLNLQGGYVFGFKNNGNGAAILADNNSVINLSGSVLAQNESTGTTGCGGAIAAMGNTEINITKGVISGNKADGVRSGENGNHRGGGGIYCDGNTKVTMSGGYITNNQAVSEEYFDGGGGIFLTGTSGFTLSSGYITGNQAQGGGGIKTDFKKAAKVTVNGGYISGNVAEAAEGGGVTIDRNGTGSFNGGYITNNKILNTVHWGGGGLFCADGSTLYLKKALITSNKAGGFGGGVAGCPTGKIYLYIDDGCAIYNNEDVVDGDVHFVNGGVKDGIDVERCDAFFQAHGHKDYFCALNSTVTGTMLGNSAANWEGSADGTAVSLGADDAQTATSVMGLEAHPTEEGIASAQDNAAVYINGNYSYTHGGGILCNGNLIVGNPTDIEVPARLGLKATKSFIDASGNEVEDLSNYNFEFQILDSNEQVVATGVCNADGTIDFGTLVFDKAGTYVYTIKEVRDNSEPSINYDSTEYRLTITVERKELPLIENTKKIAYLITRSKVEKSDGNGGWTVVSNNTYQGGKDNLALQLTEESTFVNTAVNVSKITVIKKWDGDIGADSVTVDLYQDGVLFNTVELSADNNWTHTWTDLPAGHSYHVEEREVRGYITSYETSNSQESSGRYWVPASSLIPGKQYMIVSGAGSEALYISPKHQNHGFDTSDKKAVTLKTGTLSIGNNTYSTWYEDVGIDSRCIFTAQERNKGGHKGIILKNNGASDDTWLLIQNADNNYLKSTSGSDYASNMVFENEVLKGHDGYDWNPNNLRTVIYSNGEFNTSTNTANAVKLYTLVNGSTSGESIITITNTPKEGDYELPETGGMGNYMFTIGGLFLMAVSLFAGYKSRRKYIVK